MNIKLELFDAVTGGMDGSPSVDNWHHMTSNQLEEQVAAQNEHYYDSKATSEECREVAMHIYFAQRREFCDIRHHLGNK